MPNSERPRSRPKHRNKTRIRTRAPTPEDFLESHLLHNLLASHHHPDIESQLEDLGSESNYEFDTQDEDGDDGNVELLHGLNLKMERSKNAIEDNQEEFNDKSDPVILAEDAGEFFNPPALEEIPSLSPQMYPYPMNHRPSFMGKCTPPKVRGQGFDPPFLYPEFIAKNQESRVKYIFTLVDSLVLQMEHFRKLSEHSDNERDTKTHSTGTVPKSRPQNRCFINKFVHDYPCCMEPKKLNQSKNQRYANSSEQSYHRSLEMNPELELDLDCEFGMDHIEKFRANKVRDFSFGEPGIATDREEITDNTVKKEVTKKNEPRLKSGHREFFDGFSKCEDFRVRKASSKRFEREPKWLIDEARTTRPCTPITRPCTPEPGHNKIQNSANTNWDFLIYKDSYTSAGHFASGYLPIGFTSVLHFCGHHRDQNPGHQDTRTSEHQSIISNPETKNYPTITEPKR
ncbi:hypothetical protein M5D96_011946 [Drosophila gunungcola]|uniref:Uncharacterized protein n=1 Tax=Drosophila gunungcola TaxID=103775 RepID=A0A9P9YEX1_9MUSC|nr:hypothetical protein M5D96_011946 [Drosophila gunungcola]